MIPPWVPFPVTVAFAAYVMNQVRKPSKGLGRVMASAMNESHSAMTDWGLQHASIEKNSTILDVGCGGGRTIRKHAAAASEGMVHGVDYAAGSVAASRSENRDAIAKGRVEVQQASVSQLPFPGATFDLASAVETIYYWPDPVKDLREILRVLKPGGNLIVINETYKGGRWNFFKGPAMKLLLANNFSVDELKQLLTAAGYIDVQVVVEPSHGWICAIGKRPSGLSGDHALG
jgi:ubiquinone/menaquinone biosynthesis C-methylase UbiE